ncbi:hypothetical protein T484DRAFT_1848502 [Baffinella frigidus]|nr:hypothetical protein T484DRAFT_1848502 [Cryptophyta sp. CCMP2293]
MSSENKYVPPPLRVAAQGPHGATPATARDGLPRGSREELTDRHMGESDGGPPDRQSSGVSRNVQWEQRDYAPGNPHPRGTAEQARSGGAGRGGNNSAMPPRFKLKTTLCSHFSKGCCTNRKCQFAHGEGELQRLQGGAGRGDSVSMAASSASRAY